MTVSAQNILDAAAARIQPVVDFLVKFRTGSSTESVNNGNTDLPTAAKLIADIQASATAATATASAEATAADESAQAAAANAAIYSATARSASEASGPVLIYDDYATANGALTGLVDQQIVEVMQDETRGDNRIRYRVESGALVFKVDLGRPVLDVTAFGANPDGASDVRGAFLAAKGVTPFINFPLIGTSCTYYFATLLAGDLDGAKITTDRGVTLSFPNNAPYSLYSGAEWNSPVALTFRDIQVGTSFDKLSDDLLTLSPLQTIRRRKTTFIDATTARVAHRTVVWPTGDTFTDIAPTSTSSTSVVEPVTASNFSGAFLEIGPGQSVTAHMENATAGNPIGVMIRGSLGYLVIFRDPALTGTQINAAQKPSGTAYQVLPSIDYPGIGTLTSYEPGNSTWTITRVDRKNAAVALNGRIITGPFATIGDIWEVGFVSYGSSAGSFQVTGFVLENVSILEGMPKLTELVIFGDSTAADWPGCWSRMLPRVMDNIQGIKLGSITNRAVVGETLAQQYTRMQADGFGDSYYVVICAGTNDIQGNEGVATFDTLIRNVLAYVRAAGRIPVVMLPYMWYPASARGGSGQPSANYDQGAGYRMVMSRAVAEYTPNAVLVDLPRLLPTPDPAYVGSALDPLLRDDIHPTQLCHRLYAYALAQAIVSHYCSVPANEVTTLPSYLLNAGVTIQDTLGASITQDGIVHLESILKFASATADGTVIMSVPAWLRPQGARDFSAGVLDIDSKPVGNANLVYDGISSLSVYGFPTSGVYLQMDSLTWAAGDYLPK